MLTYAAVVEFSIFPDQTPAGGDVTGLYTGSITEPYIEVVGFASDRSSYNNVPAPTGILTVGWLNGPTVFTLNLAGYSEFDADDPYPGDLPIPVSLATAAGSTRDAAGDYMLVASYSGDSSYPATTSYPAQTVDNDGTQYTSPVNATYLGLQLIPTALQVTQQPQDISSGTAINPVTVEWEDSSGKLYPYSTTVTASIVYEQSQGNRQLGGTTSVTTTNGIATFNNLVVPRSGNYSLQFTDTGGDTVNSQPFNVGASGDQLAFVSPIANGKTGEPIAPAVTVQVRSSSGAIDTSSDASVTIALASGQGLHGGTLAGTTTVTAQDGVATFNDLSIDDAGTYTLTATSDGSKSAVSSPFEINDDHLVFTKQPATTDVDAPVVFTVAAETPANKIDTSDDDQVQVSLNVISGGQNATLGGTTLLTLGDGVASFSAGNAPSVNAPGTYTLTATAMDSEMAADDAVADGTSKSFIVNPLQLVFTQQPATGNVDEPITFNVSVENSKHKVQTSFNGDVTVAMNTVAAGSPATCSGTTTVTLVNGVAAFAAAQGVEIDEVGTFTFTAEEEAVEAAAPGLAQASVVRPDGLVLAPVAPATSKSFDTRPFKLVFLQDVPLVNDTGDPIPFEVEIQDLKGNVVTDATSDQLWIAWVKNLQGKPTPATVPYYGSNFVDGVATFDDENNATIETIGKYKLEAAVYPGPPSSSMPNNNYAPAVSRDFSVNGYHLSFLTPPPSRGTAGQPIEFRVAMDDSQLNPVLTGQSSDDFIGIETLFYEKNQAQPTIQSYYLPLVDGVASFGNEGVPVIEQPGKYEFEIAAYQNVDGQEGAIDPLVTTVVSKGFLLVTGG